MKIVTGWGDQSIGEKDTYLWHCGPLQLYYKVIYDELWLAHHDSDSEQPEQALQPVDEATLKWQRWSLKKAAVSIKILPTFPDLPVIIKPETSFWMTPGVKTRVYPRIPLWIKVLLDGEALLETPILQISKTWFGDFLDGEICYWIKSYVRKEILPEQHRPFLAVSPIQIINRSDEELLVDKICHRVTSSVFSNSKASSGRMKPASVIAARMMSARSTCCAKRRRRRPRQSCFPNRVCPIATALPPRPSPR